MYGDLLMDRLVGTGGGGISVRFSGDTEAFSSDISAELTGSGSIGSILFSWLRSSTSLRTCDTMAGLGPVLRRSGFEMGEFLIPPALLLVLAALFSLAFLDSSMGTTTGACDISRSISMGELFDWVLGS
jgi:hypothetical protein